ncbi:response regulator [Dehalogenimonas etheniformans]|uniref:DNA-binding response regulator n=1 Tax=Dehalogenimonas etheniformans TaxID=1536648 RepID=A0A2P5P955_9CHLR|nr:response regulator transcription factor [Dehalogenimonas etheniformans]PPD58842.1 DNA-binding response regulator [Dehalogenimonas etheniformans]QNT76388.1 response regulator transcription factor [Dehalogenimonas etheniformans]
MSENTRILIVDDHAIVRSGLTSILAGEEKMHIIGEAADGNEAIAKSTALQPDVILLDILMPRCTGLEALPVIREKAPGARILMLTVSAEEKDLFTALKYGAQGYLLKGSGITDVVSAIRRVANGEVILSPQMAGSLVSEFRQRQANKEDIDLSPREMEVLKLVGDGLTNSEIAEKMFLGESTVRTYLSRLLDKLQLRNRAAAVAYATRRGISSNK